MKNPIQSICAPSCCTGCSSCYNVCPKKAIDMQIDKYGFFHPIVNQELCIGCKVCQKHCHVNKTVEKNDLIETVAAITKDSQMYKSSSSGGFATTLSKYILEIGGCVYGAVIDSALYVKHIRVTDVNDLHKLQGSKYAESDISGVYSLIEKDLESRKTLFIGTPCQVAGVLSYFRKRDVKNLFTVSFICGGVSSTQFLKECIGERRLHNLKNIEFRRGGKTGIWLSYSNDREIKLSYYLTPYVVGYYSKLTERLSCYNCQYSTLKRVGDITCGDFWGLHSGSLVHRLETGVSIVLPTTDKGRKLFDNIKDRFEIEYHDIAETVNSNKRLISTSQPHRNYLMFREL